MSIVKAATAQDQSSVAIDYIERIKKDLQGVQPPPGLEEFRRRLAKDSRIDG